MRLRIGTSGFSYKEWKGPFYPEDLPTSRMLAFYAARMNTVEINNTFYRMPRAESLAKWTHEVPEDFLFVLKAPQSITHVKRLKDAADSVSFFFKTAQTLDKHLGPTLFQLPPNMKKDLPRLEAFLDLVPKEHRLALEFRHPSWFEEDVYGALRSHNAALCVAEADDFACPFVLTAPYGYFRLRKTDYAAAELQDWAKRIEGSGLNDAFVFFKHEDAGEGPKLAAELKALLAKS